MISARQKNLRASLMVMSDRLKKIGHLKWRLVPFAPQTSNHSVSLITKFLKIFKKGNHWPGLVTFLAHQTREWARKTRFSSLFQKILQIRES